MKSFSAVVTPAIAAGGLYLGLQSGAAPAADCADTDDTYVCSGEIGDLTVDDASEYDAVSIVDPVTADDGYMSISLTTTGTSDDRDVTGAVLEVDLGDSSYNLDNSVTTTDDDETETTATLPLLSNLVESHDGVSGDENASGSSGSGGGASGTVSGDTAISISAFSVTADNLSGGLIVGTTTGDGGKGGKGASYGTAKGYGGGGGDAGSIEGTTSLTIDSGYFDLSLDDAASDSGVSVTSYAGDGGKGGEATSVLGAASGGDGGDGGSAGQVELTLGTSEGETSAIDLNSAVASLPVVEVVSTGGDGGAGGSADAEGNAHGGNAGSGGDAGDVSVTINDGSTLTVTSTADDAPAFYFVSTGGDGGEGGTAEDGTKYRGNGGNGGAAGTVTVNGSGVYATTEGANSIGVYALSQGGTGGYRGSGSKSGSHGVSASGGDVSVILGEGSIQTSGDQSHGVYSASLSGLLGLAGDGGDVVVSVDSAISISGTSSYGIRADSAGGVASIEAGSLAPVAETSVGSGNADGGAAGNAGTVSVSLGGTITTSGEGARGIHVTSLSSQIADLSDGSTQDAGDVTITLSGSDASILTYGDNSIAIVGYSAGYEQSGKVEVESYASTIEVYGTGGYGILLKSQTTTSAGEVIVNLFGTTVLYMAAGNEAAVYFAEGDSYDLNNDGKIVVEDGYAVLAEGADTVIDNEGTITGAILLSGGTTYSLTNQYGATLANADGNDVNYLLETEDGAVTIDNYGSLSGDFNLSGGDTSTPNTLTNYSTGVFEPGDEIYLGDTGSFGTLTNEGLLSPGGEGVIQETEVYGEAITQTSDGTLLVDLSFDDDGTLLSDKITAVFGSTGASAVIDGTVEVNWFGATSLQSGDTGTATILVSQSLETSAEVTDSATVDYELSASSDSELQLSYTVNYTGVSEGASLGRTARGFGSHLSGLIAYADTLEDGSQLKEDIGLLATDILNVSEFTDLETLYETLVVDEAAASVSTSLAALSRTFGYLQSCPDLASGAGFLRQQDCGWAKAVGTKFSQDDHGSNPGYDEASYGLIAGIQRGIDGNRFVELAGQFEDLDISGSNFSQDGYRLSAGAALKQEIGAWTVSGAIAGGFYNLDSTRTYSVSGTGYYANGDLDGRYVAAEARVNYVHQWQNVYLKPSAALAVQRTWQDGFTETGSGTLNWIVSDISTTNVSMHPQLELGQLFGSKDRPGILYAKMGVLHYLTDPEVTVTTGLSLAGDTLGTLSTQVSNDRTFGTMELGMNLTLREGLTLQLSGQGSASENTTSASGAAALRWVF